MRQKGMSHPEQVRPYTESPNTGVELILTNTRRPSRHISPNFHPYPSARKVRLSVKTPGADRAPVTLPTTPYLGRLSNP